MLNSLRRLVAGRYRSKKKPPIQIEREQKFRILRGVLYEETMTERGNFMCYTAGAAPLSEPNEYARAKRYLKFSPCRIEL